MKVATLSGRGDFSGLKTGWPCYLTLTQKFPPIITNLPNFDNANSPSSPVFYQTLTNQEAARLFDQVHNKRYCSKTSNLPTSKLFTENEAEDTIASAFKHQSIMPLFPQVREMMDSNKPTLSKKDVYWTTASNGDILPYKLSPA